MHINIQAIQITVQEKQSATTAINMEIACEYIVNERLLNTPTTHTDEDNTDPISLLSS